MGLWFDEKVHHPSQFLAYTSHGAGPSYTYNIPESNNYDGGYDVKPAVVLNSYGPPKGGHHQQSEAPVSYVQEPQSSYGSPGYGKRPKNKFKTFHWQSLSTKLKQLRFRPSPSTTRDLNPDKYVFNSSEALGNTRISYRARIEANVEEEMTTFVELQATWDGIKILSLRERFLESFLTFPAIRKQRSS